MPAAQAENPEAPTAEAQAAAEQPEAEAAERAGDEPEAVAEARSEEEAAGAAEEAIPQPAAKGPPLEAPINPNIPDLRPGDTVSVHVRIREGDRERVQEFRGTVIRIRRGGNSASFTVRRIASHGIGVERTFLFRSPRIDKVEIHRRAHVRRARLYYLRDRVGKKARLKEKREA